MGKPGLLGGYWVIPSQTSSWNRHSMPYGSLTILKLDRERIGEEKEEMHTSRYTMDRENEEMHSDSSSNSDEEDGSDNANDLVSSSNKFFLKQ